MGQLNASAIPPDNHKVHASYDQFRRPGFQSIITAYDMKANISLLEL